MQVQRDAEPALRPHVELARRARSGLVLALFDKPNPVAFEQAASALDLPFMNVSLGLAQSLLDVPVADRPFRALDLIPDIVAACKEVALGRLGLLHLTALQLDPLRALLQLARDRVVLAEWVGGYDGGVLTYAEPDSAEYGRWTNPSCAIVRMDLSPFAEMR